MTLREANSESVQTQKELNRGLAQVERSIRDTIYARKDKHEIRIGCTSKIQFHVDDGGKPVNVKVLFSTGRGLDEAIVSVLKNWRFPPLQEGETPNKDGTVLQAKIDVTFTVD